MYYIDDKLMAKCFLAGAKNLESKKEWINELNVFPVPDGDTGTNMCMTIMSAVKSVQAIDNLSMATLAKAIASGSLKGARGNSGVILSQLLRGFTRVVETHETIDVVTMCEACQKAVETAYKAVMKPKEGTILTVARGMADKALKIVGECEDVVEFVGLLLEEGELVLSKTPDMLPVLKQAGVVDSGGQGLIEVVRGFYDVLCGKEIDYSFESAPSASNVVKISAETEAEITFGYCTEFIIVLNKPMTEKDERDMKDYLEGIGDSIVVVADEDITKVHVHTNDPGLALQKALTFGSLSNIKIDNMREEHEEKLIKEAEKIAEQRKEQKTVNLEPAKDYGFISVSAGSGLSEIFTGLGVDYLIEGGQTMNPSTEDMLNAIEKVNAKDIFILPNNKNIIMAANQAAELTEDKNIHVIPTKTIPQGIVALINFIPELSADENAEAMTEALETIQTGQVTYAVRDTEIDNIKISKDDYMGVGDKTILAAGPDLFDVIKEMLSKMVTEDSSIITIYYGEDKNEDDAEAVADMLRELYEDCEVEVYNGGQPIYYYFISVE